MGCWATILHKAQIDLGWLFYVQGVVLSPAVIPIALTVTWRKLTRAGVLCGALIGATMGMLAWMMGCWKIYGKINIPNLANPYSAVCSGLTGLLFSGLISVGVSLLNPADYDFQATRAIANLDIEVKDEGDRKSPIEADEKGDDRKDSMAEATIHAASNLGPLTDLPVLKAAFRRAAIYSSTLTFIVGILVPLPMFFSQYVYSEKFFGFWIAVSIIWALLSGTFSVLLPVLESRGEIGVILKGFFNLLRGRRANRR